MCSNIMFVKGRDGFKEAIQSRLDSSWLLDTLTASHDLVTLWITGSSQLREFKMAVGSKMVFKYRLQFITDLGAYIRSENEKRHMQFSLQGAETDLEMKVWEKDREHASRMH